MRRIPAVAFATSLVVALLALAGCSSWFESPNKPANDAIAVANTHLKKATQSGAAVVTSADSLASIPFTKEGAASALALTARIKADLASQTAELTAAKQAMDSIAAMKVSADLKTYASLESTAIATRVRVVEMEGQLYSEMDKLYTARQQGATTSVDTQNILASIDSLKLDITAVTELAAQAAQTASDYFTTKKLGG
jgi:hypothetical protein